MEDWTQARIVEIREELLLLLLKPISRSPHMSTFFLSLSLSQVKFRDNLNETWHLLIYEHTP